MSEDFMPHQRAAGAQVADIVRQRGVCLLMGEPRVGKTRTVFWAVNHLPVGRVAFITKKNAIPGIQSEAKVCRKSVVVTNYEQAGKLNPDLFDMVVVDECHNIGSAGRPSLRFKTLRRLAWDKPVILLSGTPFVETPASAFYQLGVTKYTPLQFKTFYDFFRAFGVPSPIRLHGRMVEQYKKTRPDLLPVLEPYIVRITQAEAGIDARAVDLVHRFDLSPNTASLIERIKTDQVVTVGSRTMAFESDMAVRAAIHQIEAGAVLHDGEIVLLENTEMMDFIRCKFGDSPDVAVMSHFRSTRAKVAKHLPNVHIYSSDGHAEGVNLSAYRHFVILNTGYSGAKHIQRRDRGTLIGHTQAREVHHLVAAGHLSEKVYNAVSRKRDYNLATFKRECSNLRSKSEFLTTSKRFLTAGASR